MLIVVWGIRTTVAHLLAVRLLCAGCHRSTVHEMRQHTKRFTLFTAELFTISRKVTLRCANCGLTQQLSEPDMGLVYNGDTTVAPRPAWLADDRCRPPVSTPYNFPAYGQPVSTGAASISPEAVARSQTAPRGES